MSRGEKTLLAGTIAAWLSAATGVGIFRVMGAPLNLGAFLSVTTLIGMPIALGHVFVIGAPLCMVLSERWPLRWWSAALGGVAVGAAPVGVTMLVSGTMKLLTSNAHVEWGQTILMTGLGALPGLAGGLAFRAIVGFDPRDLERGA